MAQYFYSNRREFLGLAGLTLASTVLPGCATVAKMFQHVGGRNQYEKPITDRDLGSILTPYLPTDNLPYFDGHVLAIWAKDYKGAIGLDGTLQDGFCKAHGLSRDEYVVAANTPIEVLVKDHPELSGTIQTMTHGDFLGAEKLTKVGGIPWRILHAALEEQYHSISGVDKQYITINPGRRTEGEGRNVYAIGNLAAEGASGNLVLNGPTRLSWALGQRNLPARYSSLGEVVVVRPVRDIDYVPKTITIETDKGPKDVKYLMLVADLRAMVGEGISLSDDIGLQWDDNIFVATELRPWIRLITDMLTEVRGPLSQIVGIGKDAVAGDEVLKYFNQGRNERWNPNSDPSLREKFQQAFEEVLISKFKAKLSE